jgi:hypothetical protein
MIRHIYLLNKFGKPIYYKCLLENCTINHNNTEPQRIIFNALKLIANSSPYAKMKTIIFNNKKLLIETKKNINLFLEIDITDDSEEYRVTIEEMAEELNKLFQKGKEEETSEYITPRLSELIKKDRK